MRTFMASTSALTILKRIVGVAGFTAYTIAFAYFLRFVATPPPPKMPVVQVAMHRETVKKTAAFGVPVRLTIPTINVNATVASAGLTPDGSMDIKKSPTDVAWYKFGPSPGNPGSAVIAGHYGWENGRGSVFNYLHTLKPGNVVNVKDKTGGDISFVVRKIKLYNPEADASEVFVSSDGKSHLNLITCEGEWMREKQTYSHRLVVFSDKM